MLLVTGITGNSGRYFLQELINHEYDGAIRCIVRSASDISALNESGLKVETVYGDLSDRAFMKACMVGIDTVLHIAGIQQTINVVEPASQNNVKRIILVHTTGIYSKFKSASEEYKSIEQRMEQIVSDQNYLIRVIILRPTMIYGNLKDLNMSKFIKMIDKLKIFPVINNGISLIQPVNARDLGKAYYHVLMGQDTGRNDYILSGDKPIMMIDAFKLISKALGKKTIFISVPLWAGVFLAKMLYVASLGKVDYIEKVQRMGEDRSFPHDYATRDFYFNPMPFDEGIKIEVEQYKAQMISEDRFI